MISIHDLLTRSITILLLSAIDFFGLLGSYGLLRLLHISANWVTWIIGTGLIVVSTFYCLSLLAPIGVPPDVGTSNLLGFVAFLIAIDSWSQWVTRRGYLLLKKLPLVWLTTGVREAFLFLRKHHQFLGWLVVITAVAHVAYFLPILANVSQYEVITGFVALAFLAVGTGLGWWIELAVRRKQASQNVSYSHHDGERWREFGEHAVAG
jgi:hypothetical protein